MSKPFISWPPSFIYWVYLRLSPGALSCFNFYLDDFIMPTFHNLICKYLNPKYVLLILFYWILYIYRQLPTQNLCSSLSLHFYIQILKNRCKILLCYRTLSLLSFLFFLLLFFFIGLFVCLFCKWKLTSWIWFINKNPAHLLWKLVVFISHFQIVHLISPSTVINSKVPCILSQFNKNKSYCCSSEQPNMKQIMVQKVEKGHKKETGLCNFDFVII